jgi:hypothetical protein
LARGDVAYDGHTIDLGGDLLGQGLVAVDAYEPSSGL